MSAMQWDSQNAFPAVYEELLVPAFFTEFANRILDRAQPQAGERMLDVATGTGIVLRLARGREPGIERLVGLDLMPGMLAVAQEQTGGLAVELVQGDAGALPFEDDSFDLVTCQQGLQFFPERENALREFRRVLAPGGRAVVSCWSELATSPAHELLVGVLKRHLPESGRVARAPYSLSSADDLRSLLEGAGFDDVGVERVDGTGRFATPEDYARSFVEGSPMALAVADLPIEQRGALLREIADGVRERFGEPVSAPMATNIAIAHA